MPVSVSVSVPAKGVEPASSEGSETETGTETDFPDGDRVCQREFIVLPPFDAAQESWTSLTWP